MTYTQLRFFYQEEICPMNSAFGITNNLSFSVPHCSGERGFYYDRSNAVYVLAEMADYNQISYYFSEEEEEKACEKVLDLLYGEIQRAEQNYPILEETSEENEIYHRIKKNVSHEDEFTFGMMNKRDNTIAIMDYTGDGTIVSIPEKDKEGHIVDYIYHLSKREIQSVTCPSHMESLRGKILYRSFVEEVKLNEGCKRIGDHAFAMCFHLQHIQLPKSINCMEGYAFAASGLESIEIPTQISEISMKCFYRTHLSKVEIPGNVKTIGIGAFDEISELTEVEIKEGVRKICKNAFYRNENLSKIWIPKSVEDISSQNFMQVAKDFTIYGYPGSYAEEYAMLMDFSFVAIDE